MNILLKPVARRLEEVEIKSKNEAIPYFKDDKYTVLDYEAYNTLVYLLIYQYGRARSELICKSDNGDTVAVSGCLPFKPATFFADCLGCLHVLSADSAYQVFVDKDTIIFTYRTEINRFLRTMSDCVASSEEWLYFREESVDRLVINFLRINRNSKALQYLASASDYMNMMYLRKNPGDYYYLAMDTLPATPAEIVQWMWVRKILYRENASVMKKIGDSLILFNTANATINKYDESGKYFAVFTMPVEKLSGEKWQRDIIFDEPAHQPYTTFIRGGKLKVYRIDLSTGKLVYQLTTSHIFPEKIRIDNNYLYYLYNQPGINDTKKVYRQKI
jgi:hypothetical protein